MKENFELDAEIRTDLGKGASRRLRRMNKVPGVIYGAGQDTQSITLTHNVLQQHLEHESFYSHILSVNVDGKPHKAILRDLQRHPSKQVILHIDFLRISDTEKLRISVPVHFINEDDCVGVKAGGGSITHHLVQLDVSCLPKDIPEFITVDMADIELGSSVHLSEVTLPENVSLVELDHGHDLAIVNVIKPRGEVIEEETDGDEAAASDTPEE
ncbi:LSU ribosomal protein L25p [hydrothermal vent metagenome]|uniref:LSU ribosomal protein L25p n=1 Tax=hydrothermal vent metagenome TaxID=652676 RepID=A0A3B0YRG7_9ZZZZ